MNIINAMDVDEMSVFLLFRSTELRAITFCNIDEPTRVSASAGGAAGGVIEPHARCFFFLHVQILFNIIIIHTVHCTLCTVARHSLRREPP